MLARVVWTANAPKFKSLPSKLSTTVGDRVPVLRVIVISGPLRSLTRPPSRSEPRRTQVKRKLCARPDLRKLDNKLHSCAILPILDLQISELGDAAEQYFGEPARTALAGTWISSHHHGGGVPGLYWSTAVIDWLA